MTIGKRACDGKAPFIVCGSHSNKVALLQHRLADAMNIFGSEQAKDKSRPWFDLEAGIIGVIHLRLLFQQQLGSGPVVVNVKALCDNGR